MNNINAGDTYHNRYSKDRQYNKKSKKYKPLPNKCSHCGTTKGPFDIHHKDGNRKNFKRSNLTVLCRSCHRKLHDGGGKGSANASILYAEGIIVEQPSNLKKLQDAIGSEKTDDLMLVEFKLCHAGINNNMDEFLEDEMEKGYKTIRYKPIDWEHTTQNIGVVYDSEFVKATEEETSYIKCYGYIWKYKHPTEAQATYQRYIDGNLTFSMETWFDKAECSECKGEFKKPDKYCDHLLSRYETHAVSRKLHGLNFGGAGIVKKPADKKATGDLVVAKEINNKESYYAALASFVTKYCIHPLYASIMLKTEKKNDN